MINFDISAITSILRRIKINDHFYWTFDNFRYQMFSNDLSYSSPFFINIGKPFFENKLKYYKFEMKIEQDVNKDDIGSIIGCIDEFGRIHEWIMLLETQEYFKLDTPDTMMSLLKLSADLRETRLENKSEVQKTKKYILDTAELIRRPK